jgi:hypothetical protein
MSHHNWFSWRANSAGWPGAVVVGAFTVLGATMLLQPDRYNEGAAYGIVVDVLDIRVWGVLYLLVAILKAAYLSVLRLRPMAVLVHIASFVLASWWLVALLIRYVTDRNAAVVPSLLWVMLMLLILRSVSLMVPTVVRGRGGEAL